MKIEELYAKARDAAHWAIYITDDFRCFNLDAGIRLYRNFLANMQWIIQSLLTSPEQTEQLGLQPDGNYIISMMQGMLGAQEQKDYVLLADLIELQAMPFLMELLNAVREHAPQVEYTGYLEQNLKVLESKDALLAAKVRSCRNLVLSKQIDEAVGNETAEIPSDSNRSCRPGTASFVDIAGARLHQSYPHVWLDQTTGVRYVIEATSVGYPTCCVETEGAAYYLHSNKDPYDEAKKWLQSVTDETSRAYHILGCGLGYEGITLYWTLMGNYPVHIYETDLNMICLALNYGHLSTAMSERLYLHYDPNYGQLLEATAMPEHKLCIHYPSLRGIRNEKISAHFQHFFLQDSSFQNAKLLLQGNFDANLDSLESQPERVHLVDELKPVFQGKNVIIVAAGPSLDKNISQLVMEKRPENSLVIATGTVFKKLLGLGISPDYVMVTDPNERVTFQIRGVEDQQIPMLMLSTANHKFMTLYRAEHYLIFQNGYGRSESAAELLQQTLYETGGSVSTTALDMSIRLGAARIIFMGLDLAFTDNLAHASDTSNRIAADTQELIPVTAQDGGTVYADHKFIIYREWMERRLTQEDAKRISVINATEGGSLIRGMQHMTLAEAWKLLEVSE